MFGLLGDLRSVESALSDKNYSKFVVYVCLISSKFDV